MKHYRRTTSCWLISQALCFCLLLQGSGIAQALPLPPKKTFVSKSELETGRLRSAIPDSEPEVDGRLRSGPLERFVEGLRLSAGEAGGMLQHWLEDQRTEAAAEAEAPLRVAQAGGVLPLPARLMSVFLASATQGRSGPPDLPGLGTNEVEPTPPAEIASLMGKSFTEQIALLGGFNLISIPEEPADPDPAAVLGPIAGQLKAAFAYDACDPVDPWKIYDPADAAGSDLTAIDHRNGLWIDATAPAVLQVAGTQPATTQIQLCTGWNLIGYPLAQPRPPLSALASIAGQLLRVFAFDPAHPEDLWEGFDTAVPDWANNLPLMEPGRGYWVLVTEDAVLDYENVGAAPVVEIVSPLSAAEIAGPKDVVGTVRSNLLSSWTLSYRASGVSNVSDPFVTIASGNTPLESALLGSFDPTLLLNGMYDLKLEALDFQGRIVEATVPIVLDGQRKIGHFTLSFSDLQVPLSGLDIEVVRTYDSRDKKRHDFGVGWTLDVKQGSYVNNRPPGDGWEIVDSQPPVVFPCVGGVETKSHLTTVRLSDQEVYRFRLEVFNTGPNLGGCLGQVRFAYVDGPTSTASLEILGNTDVLWSSGSDFLFDPITVDVFNPRDVRLITRDGRQFDFVLGQGVEKIRDTNGNEIQITPTSISHSSGASITMTRDAEERITQITDPAGATLDYAYTAAGDLVSVVDRGGNTTTFSYDTNHGLLDIFDPLGNRPVRNHYDENGRLVSTTDALGNTISFSRDIGARREVITNRLGASRVLEYDARGNVTREVDELGNQTLRTFNSDDNLLAETDPLGRTTMRTYTVSGEIATVTDPAGNVTAFTYDASGSVLTTTDPRGGVTTNVYDGKGNLTQITDALGSITTFTCDAQGNVLTDTDPAGSVTTFEYDARGNLIRQTDPLGQVTEFTYDARGNRLSEVRTRTVAGGATEFLTTTFLYDQSGRLVSTTHPDGSTETQTFDPLGRLTSRTDSRGGTTTSVHDAQGRLARTIFPDGTSEDTTYDAEGRELTNSDRAGRTTALSYDAAGQLVTTTFPDGATTTNTFDAAGQLIAQTDERGYTTSFVYDAAGRRAQTIDGLGNATSFTYDANGNLVAVTNALGQTTTFTVDALNRRSATTFADGTSQSATFDALSRRVSDTDQAGQVIVLGYDALGRLTAVTDPLSQTTSYTYDEIGNRRTQTDANGHVTTFGYDAMGRQTSRTLPDGSTETVIYNADGSVASHTDFLGQVTSFTYDLDSRLTRRDHADGSAVTWTYTPTGQQASYADARGTTSFTYDARDRVISKTAPDARRLGYTYDAAGNRTSLTATVGAAVLTTTYAYDALSRLLTVAEPSGGVLTHTYDAAGNRVALAFPNGITTTTAYDQLHRLTSLTTATSTGGVLQSFGFTLDPTGRRTRIDEADGTSRSYNYDVLSRLTQERVTDVAGGLIVQRDFAYDPVGNRLTLTRDSSSGDPTTTSNTYDARDRLLTEGTTSYSWNTNGNMISKSGPDGAVYGWNSERRLRGVTQADGTSVVTLYDPDGVRVRTEVTPPGGPTEVTDFLVDTTGPLSHVVVESDGAGDVVAHYVRGDELLSLLRPGSGERRFFHADGLGSVRLLTDDAAAVADRYLYTAFGVLVDHVGADPQPYRFTGESFDPNVGFYFNRARWLDVASGRFVSMDPFDGVLGDPISLHRYLYAQLDPANVVDPSGAFGSFNSLVVSIAVRVTIFTMQHPYLAGAIGVIAGLLVPVEFGEAMMASGNPLGTSFGRLSVGRARFFALVKSGRFRAYVQRNLSAAGRLWQVTGDEFEGFVRKLVRGSRNVRVGPGRHSADMEFRTILLEAKTGRTIKGREIAQLDAIAGEAAQRGSGFIYQFLLKPTAAAIRRVEEAGGTVLWFFENIDG